MSFVDSTSGLGGSQASAQQASSANTGLNQLENTQTFLNLLVAQLKNQNPDNPSDPTAFMTEIAQLSQVQSQSTLDAEEQTVAADSMLGQIVGGTTAGGKKINGQVVSILLPSTGSPELVLAGANGTSTTLQLDQVNQVYSSAYLGGSNSSSTNSSSSQA